MRRFFKIKFILILVTILGIILTKPINAKTINYQIGNTQKCILKIDTKSTIALSTALIGVGVVVGKKFENKFKNSR